MKNIFKILAIAVLLNVALVSCNRNGCTDKDAFNYDSNAKKNDCSCIYSANLLVWYTPEASNYIYNNWGANYCYLYIGHIDDYTSGSYATNDTTSIAPSCDNPTRALQIFMGNNKKKDVILYFEIPSSPYTIIKTDTITLNANDCYVYKVTF